MRSLSALGGRGLSGGRRRSADGVSALVVLSTVCARTARGRQVVLSGRPDRLSAADHCRRPIT
ncbi:hypothetical protein [Streptomyces sp. NPDC003635]